MKNASELVEQIISKAKARKENARTIPKEVFLQRVATRDTPKQYKSARATPSVIKYTKEKSKEAIRKGSKMLLFHGATGNGKTHYLWSLAHESNERQASQWLGDDSEVDEDLARAFIRDQFYSRHKIVYWPNLILYGKPDVDEIERCRKFPHVLCMDDIAKGNGGFYAMDAICTILNHRIENGLWTICTTNREPRELAEIYDESVVSRLMSGAYHRMKGGDRRLAK